MSMLPIDEQLAAEEAAERRERPLRCGFRALFQAIAAAEAEAHGFTVSIGTRSQPHCIDRNAVASVQVGEVAAA